MQKKWWLIVGAGLLVVGATILLTPLGGAVVATTVGEVAVVGGGGAVMAGLVNDGRMSEEEINQAFEGAEGDERVSEPGLDPQPAPDSELQADDASWASAMGSEDLGLILSAALSSNDLSARTAARATLVDLAERDPEAALGAIEVGLKSHRNEVRTSAGEALILVTERLENPRQVHSLVVRAIRSPHHRLRRQGGEALQVFVRRTSEAKQAERGGLIAQLPPALQSTTSKPLTSRARTR